MPADHLILNRSDVTRLSSQPINDPHVTLVYQMADGSVVPADYPVARRKGVRRRFDVDTSVFRLEFEDEVMSASPPDRFLFNVAATFQVTDAVKIVSDGIIDAQALVKDYVLLGIGEVVRRHDSTSFTAAQDQLAQLFGQRIVMREGLTILSCAVKLKLRDGQFGGLVRINEARIQGQVDDVVRANQKRAAEAEAEKRKIAAQAEADAAKLRRDAVADADMSEDGLRRAALAHDPGSARELLNDQMAANAAYIEQQQRLQAEAFAQQRQINQDRLAAAATLQNLKLLAPTARNQMTEEFLADGRQYPPSAALPSGRPTIRVRQPHGFDDIRDAETVDDEPPVVRTPRDTPPTMDGKLPRPESARTPTVPRHQLIYLMLDESDAITPHLDLLHDGLADLMTHLVGHPAARIHLSIIGVGATPRVVLPMSSVDALPTAPALVPRGDARWAAALDALTTAISSDTATLKADGHRLDQPLVLLLATDTPVTDDPWLTALRRLTDRDEVPAVPMISAFGVGPTDPRFVRRVASRSGFGFLAPSDVPVDGALRSFLSALRTTVADIAAPADAGIVRIHQPTAFTVIEDET